MTSKHDIAYTACLAQGEPMWRAELVLGERVCARCGVFEHAHAGSESAEPVLEMPWDAFDDEPEAADESESEHEHEPDDDIDEGTDLHMMIKAQVPFGVELDETLAATAPTAPRADALASQPSLFAMFAL